MGLRKLVIQEDPEGKKDEVTTVHSAPRDPAVSALSEERAEGSSVPAGRRFDHVLAAAIRRGLLFEAQIQSAGLGHSGSDAALSWRQFAIARPEQSAVLSSLAAEVYGFRPVTACQIGTLIYNRKLTEYFSTADWNRIFERGMVPVIEYGNYPENVRHHLLACADPGSRYVRSLLPELPLSRMELVFIPKAGIQKLQRLLSENVSALSVNPFVAKRIQAIDEPAPDDFVLTRRAA